MLRLPVILFGKTFWDRIINMNAMVEEGVISVADLDLFHYAETAEEGNLMSVIKAWKIICQFYKNFPEQSERITMN